MSLCRPFCTILGGQLFLYAMPSRVFDFHLCYSRRRSIRNEGCYRVSSLGQLTGLISPFTWPASDPFFASPLPIPLALKASQSSFQQGSRTKYPLGILYFLIPMSSLVGDLRPESWPEPNYVNPKTRTSLVWGLMISGAGLSIIFTAGRLFAKAKRSNKGALGADDWLMTLSTVRTSRTAFFNTSITNGLLQVMMLGVNVLGCVSTTVGSGYHTWDVRPEWPITWGKVRFQCV